MIRIENMEYNIKDIVRERDSTDLYRRGERYIKELVSIKETIVKE